MDWASHLPGQDCLHCVESPVEFLTRMWDHDSVLSSAIEGFDVTEIGTQLQMPTLLPDFQDSSRPENPSPAGASPTCR